MPTPALAWTPLSLSALQQRLPSARPGPDLLRLDLPTGASLLCLARGEGCALFLLGGEGMAQEGETEALSQVLEATGLDTADLGAIHPMVVVDALPVWEVWRQDDNGGVFQVRRLRCGSAAERLCAELAARGHKQIYWVAPGG